MNETYDADRLQALAFRLGLPVERDPHTDEIFVRIAGTTYRAQLPAVV